MDAAALFNRLSRLFALAVQRGDIVAAVNVATQLTNFNPFLFEVPQLAWVYSTSERYVDEGYRPDHVDDDHDVIERDVPLLQCSGCGSVAQYNTILAGREHPCYRNSDGSYETGGQWL